MTLGQMIFLRDHHHLISPWPYTADEIKSRNSSLLLLQWAVNNG